MRAAADIPVSGGPLRSQPDRLVPQKDGLLELIQPLIGDRAVLGKHHLEVRPLPPLNSPCRPLRLLVIHQGFARLTELVERDSLVDQLVSLPEAFHSHSAPPSPDADTLRPPDRCN